MPCLFGSAGLSLWSYPGKPQLPFCQSNGVKWTIWILFCKWRLHRLCWHLPLYGRELETNTMDIDATISCSSPLFKCCFLRQSLELLMCSSHIQVSQLRAMIRYYCTFLALAPFRTKQDKMLIWFDYVRFLDPLSESTSHSYIMQLGVLKIDMQVLNIIEKFICLHNPLRLQKTTAHASGWAENRIDYIIYINLLIWYIISILSTPSLYPFLHQFCPKESCAVGSNRFDGGDPCSHLKWREFEGHLRVGRGYFPKGGAWYPCCTL